jgi:hypothetical protein
MIRSSSHTHSMSLPRSTPVGMPIPSSMCIRSSVGAMPAARPLPLNCPPPMPPSVPSRNTVSSGPSVRSAA